MSKAIIMKNSENEIIYPCPYYPIGSIYLSVNSVNPSQFFGGKWERIQDRFLLACGPKYSNGSSGGSSVVTLTPDQMPSHSHTASTTSGGEHQHVMWFGGGANSGNGGQIPVANSRWGQDTAGQTNGEHSHNIAIGNSGGSQPHDNMPPYLAVHVWKRVE